LLLRIIPFKKSLVLFFRRSASGAQKNWIFMLRFGLSPNFQKQGDQYERILMLLISFLKIRGKFGRKFYLQKIDLQDSIARFPVWK